jgi:hypothetical protein
VEGMEGGSHAYAARDLAVQHALEGVSVALLQSGGNGGRGGVKGGSGPQGSVRLPSESPSCVGGVVSRVVRQVKASMCRGAWGAQ